MFDPILIYIIGESHADFFFEQHGKIDGIDIELFGQHIQGKVYTYIRMDIGQRFPDDRRILLQVMIADQACI